MLSVRKPRTFTLILRHILPVEERNAFRFSIPIDPVRNAIVGPDKKGIS